MRTGPSPPVTRRKFPTAPQRSSSASRRASQTLGVTPLGEFVGYGQVAGPTPSLLQQPANAISAALANAKLTLDDLDVIEISEASRLWR